MATNKKSTRRLTPLAVLALLLVLAVAEGGTLAWITAHTEPITNTFTAASPGIEVEEEFEKNVKSDVQVQNTGDIPVYIRVALIPTWGTMVDDKFVPAGEPASLSNLTIIWGDVNGTAAAPGNGWIQIGNYWYYTSPVQPGDATGILIKSATAELKDGLVLNLQVLADSIQANPVDAVESAWPVEVVNEILTESN